MGRSSLAKMAATCFSTERSEMCSAAAIDVFERPSAIAVSTCLQVTGYACM
jgi:hypothetical protein